MSTPISGDPAATSQHADALLASILGLDGVVGSASCDSFEITCKPKMLSCDPVAECANLKHPGCDPLDKCAPVGGTTAMV